MTLAYLQVVATVGRIVKSARQRHRTTTMILPRATMSVKKFVEVVTWRLFFFSSRRRHTRFDCDWSSDVCSSDLILENVRGADVFVVQPCHAPVDNHLLELLLMIDAFKRASAWRITAVLPYYCYARQVGRGAWWGRVEILVVGVLLKKKKKVISSG